MVVRACQKCGADIRLDILNPLATAPLLLCSLCAPASTPATRLTPDENPAPFEVEALELDGVVLDVTVKI